MKHLTIYKIVFLLILNLISIAGYSQIEAEPTVNIQESEIVFDYNKNLFAEKDANMVYSSKSNAVLSANLLNESFDNLKKNYLNKKEVKTDNIGNEVSLLTENGIEFFMYKSFRFDGTEKIDTETLIKKNNNKSCIIVSFSYKTAEAVKYNNEGKKAITTAKVIK